MSGLFPNKIIPHKGYLETKGAKLDYTAIAFWLSSGFFFENDTFWQGESWKGLDFEKQPWRYKPESITLEAAVEEFAALFHKIIAEQVVDKKIILPLSGGLDSRSMAVALKVLGKKPYAYSYQFAGGIDESKYGAQIAGVLGWQFNGFDIPPGYLWPAIENAAEMNHCYAEFTHARQVAVSEKVSKQGDVWLLGHWGDVLFDDMGVHGNLPYEDQLQVLKKKILKKGGLELAGDLWKAWGLAGDFSELLVQRIEKMHSSINIADANARIRAFKSLYWATRWTGTNLAFFEHYKPIALPYYDDRMCEFVMRMPEKLLTGRQIQIAYIKKYAPELAQIPWQAKAPYNLYNYQKHLAAAHLPYRMWNKGKRLLAENIAGRKTVLRNWEIQFLGADNKEQLEGWLFGNEKFTRIVPKEIVEKYYKLFREGNQLYWSHTVSMLLTLSVFVKKNL